MPSTVNIVPFPALGDITICLRLAQTFHQAGYKVNFYTDMMADAQTIFDWVTICSSESVKNVDLSDEYLLMDVLSPISEQILSKVIESKNCVLFTAKSFPKEIKKLRLAHFQGELLPDRALCLNDKQGKSMVEWADDFTEKVFGLKASQTLPEVRLPAQTETAQDKVIIFPTTPNPKKNYWLGGFAKIASKLMKNGKEPQIVVVPAEQESVRKSFSELEVHSFSSIADLMVFMADARVVISNDSGGGHLAAMLGIPTITITRKSENFVWRPGYGKAYVVTPLFTFKLGGGHIWRPLVSQKKIISRALLLTRRSDI